MKIKNLVRKNKSIYKVKKHIFLTIILVFTIIITNIGYNFSNLYAVTIEEEINAFPESYRSSLLALKSLHPNWTFTPLNTGLKWSEVIQAQEYKNAIEGVHYDIYMKKNSNGTPMSSGESNWFYASEDAIKYVMDPRNHLNAVSITQFENLNYDSTTTSKTISGIEVILLGTNMHNTNIKYRDQNGTYTVLPVKYSQAIMDAANQNNVNPYHIASRIKKENSCRVIVDENSKLGDQSKPISSMLSGLYPGYEGYFNFYNIDATPKNGNSALVNGLLYAKSKNWTDPYKAIVEGSKFLKDYYITPLQNTLYLQKFNVDNSSSYSLYTHQYMTNLIAPVEESYMMYRAHKNTNTMNQVRNFIIPVFLDMPSIPMQINSINSGGTVADRTKVTVNGSINVRSGPGVGYIRLTTVQSGEILTRIEKGISNYDESGETWHKIMTDEGLVGYIRNDLLIEFPYIKVTSLSISKTNILTNVGESVKIDATVSPTNAAYKAVYWSSSNNNVATVSQTGLVTAIAEGTAIITVKTDDQNKIATCQIKVESHPISLDKTTYTLVIGEEVTPVITTSPTGAAHTIAIENENIAKLEGGKIKALAIGETKITASLTGTDDKFEATIKVIPEPEYVIHNSLSVKNQIITKVTPGTTVSNIKGKITTTSLTVRLKNSSGNTLSDASKVGTGTKIELLNHQNQIVDSFKIVVYGDLSGDGIIDSLDILILRRHLLNVTKLEGEFYKAANISKDAGEVVDSLDILMLRRHLLGVDIIKQ